MPDRRKQTKQPDALLFDFESSADIAARMRTERRQKVVTEALAASVAGEVGQLRQALAEILAAQDGYLTFGGACSCGGKKNACRGHVTEVTKIARSALGLPAFPDLGYVAWEESADA